MLMTFIPRIRQPADGFAEPHGKLGNRLQALDGPGRKAVAPREQ